MPKILSDPKARMLRELEKLLVQDGYNAVTVRSVAAGCNVGVGTVYNYFPSKEAMLAEYLLEDWQKCIAVIETVSNHADTAEPVAQCIYDQLVSYAIHHKAIFQAEDARSTFAGSFSQYHGLLRSQLASPLRKFCGNDFGSLFLAEALLTWTMAGKDFSEIWGMISPLVK